MRHLPFMSRKSTRVVGKLSDHENTSEDDSDDPTGAATPHDDFKAETSESQQEGHSDTDTKSITIKKAPQKNSAGPTRRKMHYCKECGFCTDRHSNLTRHTLTHTNERPFKCHLCERAFRAKVLLHNHINTHIGVKPHNCTEPGCEMAFVTGKELSRHIKYRHTHEKPFKCTLCDYGTVEYSKLQRHFRSHTGERPYNCDECGKAFADSFHLKRHQKSHTGEKPYECPHCKRRFTQLGSVKTHINQKHLRTVPKITCKICFTQLGRVSDLNAHMRKQHSYQEIPNECRYCDQLFHDHWSLTNHEKTHRNCGIQQAQSGRQGRKRCGKVNNKRADVVLK